jgi:hypothetical protein
MVRLLAWAMACALPALASAHAADGRCNLNARKVSGTYGFAAQGVAIGANPFAPIGPFAQSGTVTSTARAEGARTIRGSWTATLAQNDAQGYKPEVTFGGTFEIDKRTCGGDYFLGSPGGAPAFRVIIVDDGEEVRTISALPNLIVAYLSAKRL